MRYYRVDMTTGEVQDIERWQWERAVAGDYGLQVAATWAGEWGHHIDIGGWSYRTEINQ